MRSRTLGTALLFAVLVLLAALGLWVGIEKLGTPLVGEPTWRTNR